MTVDWWLVEEVLGNSGCGHRSWISRITHFVIYHRVVIHETFCMIFTQNVLWILLCLFQETFCVIFTHDISEFHVFHIFAIGFNNSTYFPILYVLFHCTSLQMLQPQKSRNHRCYSRCIDGQTRNDSNASSTGSSWLAGWIRSLALPGLNSEIHCQWRGCVRSFTVNLWPCREEIE